MAVLDEPNTLDNDDSRVSNVEIVDSGSDTDICNKSELTKFSKMLCGTQKRALTAEKAKENKQKAHTGHSRATAYH